MPVNDIDLFVRRFGDPALPMLVVVHGGPTWDHPYLLPAVAEAPASTLVEIPDAAHMAHFDNPAEWLGAVRALLAAQP
jgi:pimeloyl-ACP methyl ester carboxylesterase